jgi:hypothetical protein
MRTSSWPIPRIHRDTRGLLAALAVLTAAALAALRTGADAAEMQPSLASRLLGDTLNVVVYAQRSAAFPNETGLLRFSLQAYLQQDGSALVRLWTPARDRYTPAVEGKWTLSGDRLCLDIPNPDLRRICADVHVWGRRLAGVGTGPYVMLDGDLTPGNTIFRTR